jgi:hypothetical protein
MKENIESNDTIRESVVNEESNLDSMDEIEEEEQEFLLHRLKV